MAGNGDPGTKVDGKARSKKVIKPKDKKGCKKAKKRDDDDDDDEQPDQDNTALPTGDEDDDNDDYGLEGLDELLKMDDDDADPKTKKKPAKAKGGAKMKKPSARKRAEAHGWVKKQLCHAGMSV